MKLSIKTNISLRNDNEEMNLVLSVLSKLFEALFLKVSTKYLKNFDLSASHR